MESSGRETPALPVPALVKLPTRKEESISSGGKQKIPSIPGFEKLDRSLPPPSATKQPSTGSVTKAEQQAVLLFLWRQYENQNKLQENCSQALITMAENLEKTNEAIAALRKQVRHYKTLENKWARKTKILKRKVKLAQVELDEFKLASGSADKLCKSVSNVVVSPRRKANNSTKSKIMGGGGSSRRESASSEGVPLICEFGSLVDVLNHPRGNAALRSYAAAHGYEQHVVFWSVVKKFKEQFASKGAGPMLHMIAEELMHTHLKEGAEQYVNADPLKCKEIQSALGHGRLEGGMFDGAQADALEVLRTHIDLSDFLASTQLQQMMDAKQLR
mmetsp:Transcript_20570/g.52083  ORF Transcript_20570/g.52083 Transcript_20570/m.52083 type:complete len:332 (-) Transcript_20570:124-1119(-)